MKSAHFTSYRAYCAVSYALCCMPGYDDGISSRQYYSSDSNHGILTMGFYPIRFSLGDSALSLSSSTAYEVAFMVTYAVA